MLNTLVCSARYGTESSNNTGGIPCWGIWVVFANTVGLKNSLLKSIADSEIKVIS